MFCAAVTTINKCKTEGVIDVFQVLKSQRIQKPGSVQTIVSDRLQIIAFILLFLFSQATISRDFSDHTGLLGFISDIL